MQGKGQPDETPDPPARLLHRAGAGGGRACTRWSSPAAECCPRRLAVARPCAALCRGGLSQPRPRLCPLQSSLVPWLCGAASLLALSVPQLLVGCLETALPRSGPFWIASARGAPAVSVAGQRALAEGTRGSLLPGDVPSSVTYFPLPLLLLVEAFVSAQAFEGSGSCWSLLCLGGKSPAATACHPAPWPLQPRALHRVGRRGASRGVGPGPGELREGSDHRCVLQDTAAALQSVTGGGFPRTGDEADSLQQP